MNIMVINLRSLYYQNEDSGNKFHYTLLNAHISCSQNRDLKYNGICY